MAMRNAKMDAIEKAVRKAIRDGNSSPWQKNNIRTGRVYIVETSQDRSRIPYQIDMVLQVQLD